MVRKSSGSKAGKTGTRSAKGKAPVALKAVWSLKVAASKWAGKGAAALAAIRTVVGYDMTAESKVVAEYGEQCYSFLVAQAEAVKAGQTAKDAAMAKAEEAGKPEADINKAGSAARDKAARAVWAVFAPTLKVGKKLVAPSSGAEVIRATLGIDAKGYGPLVSKTRTYTARYGGRYAKVNGIAVPKAGTGRQALAQSEPVGSMVVKLKSEKNIKTGFYPVPVNGETVTKGWKSSDGAETFTAQAVINGAVAALGVEVIAILSREAQAVAKRRAA